MYSSSPLIRPFSHVPLIRPDFRCIDMVKKKFVNLTNQLRWPEWWEMVVLFRNWMCFKYTLILYIYIHLYMFGMRGTHLDKDGKDIGHNKIHVYTLLPLKITILAQISWDGFMLLKLNNRTSDMWIDHKFLSDETQLSKTSDYWKLGDITIHRNISPYFIYLDCRKLVM
jgi:hypothetical protein